MQAWKLVSTCDRFRSGVFFDRNEVDRIEGNMLEWSSNLFLVGECEVNALIYCTICKRFDAAYEGSVFN